MQCPRCGWQNPLDITACQRCGLAVQQGPPPAVAETGTGYGPPGYPGGYPAGAYGAPAGQPYGQQPAPYTQPYAQPVAPAPYAPYGSPPGSPYATGAVAAPGTSSGWPAPAPTAAPAGSGRLARLLLAVGAVASLGYAIWAMTARRGIFDDFVHNRSVSVGTARSSDRTDTILLVVAGGLAVIALAFWLVRVVAGRSRSGALTVAGFLVSGLGMVAVVVGLVLSGMVGSNGDRAAEGRRAVTATIVTGSGFIALAVGLVIGLLVVNARRAQGDGHPAATTPATPGW